MREEREREKGEESNGGLLRGLGTDPSGTLTSQEPTEEEEKDIEAHKCHEEITYRAPESIEYSGLLRGHGTDSSGTLTPQEPTGERREEERNRSKIYKGEVQEDLCLLGLDVVALFPSMTSKRTGKLVRKAVMKSRISLEGYDWKTGLVYIVMNKHLTTNLGSMWKILPYRRKVGGQAPGMSSKEMKRRKGSLDKQWVFKTQEVGEEEKREIAGRCAEIAVRVVFENFAYNFGGVVRKQKEGG